jgi:DNA-binding PadR family transcriptional regulator
MACLLLCAGSDGWARVGNKGCRLRTLMVGFMFGQAGFMGRAREQRAKQRGPSQLTTAVLAAIVAQPSHGWEITKWINARLAPIGRSYDWRRVYEVLGQLEAGGLAWSEAVHDASAPNGTKRVFHATTRGLAVCPEWLQASVESDERVWEDMQAWMLLSRPQEAPAILDRLAELEKDCMEKSEGKGPSVRSRSWEDRMLSQHRASIREKYRYRLRCISLARREIEEYLAPQQ